MKPFDPRLLKYARETRRYIIFLVVLGVITSGVVACQTFFISAAISPVFYGEKTLQDVTPLIGAVALTFLARALLSYVQQAFGHRSALRVIARLRSQVLRHAAALGDRWLSKGNTSRVVTLSTRGLDDLEAYFVAFLPQLFLSVTATPILIAVIFYLDWISALAIVLCIPLIPIFMVLIGKMTAHYSSRRLKAMEELGSQLLDLLAGLTTLKALGREQGPKQQVQRLGNRFAATTLQTLYVAFLSGAVLEFLATLSTAIVAVEVGFRMVAGNLMLFEGLVIITLTPEVFKPLREVGTQFHASSNGISAAKEAFAVLETPLPPRDGKLPAPDLRTSSIEIDDVSVRAPGRATVAPAHLSAVITPGTVTALRGPSGAGKSTTVSVLLGLLAPDAGAVRIGDVPLSNINRDEWWQQITWVPQQPALIPGTVAENIANLVSPDRAEQLGLHEPDSAEALAHASHVTGFDSVVASLPDGWHTAIGQGGVGLSVGQRQRLALTRALLSEAPLVVLDEPTAHLDATSEEQIKDAILELKAQGHTVIVIAHREAISRIADQEVWVESALEAGSEVAQ